MRTQPPICDFGFPAPDFTLPATDGKDYAFADIRGENGCLLVFMCNHCPFVLRILDKIIRDATELTTLGIGVAAISSNNVVEYPQDSFENMQKLVTEYGIPFPYLYDESQEIARAYGAVCTPDFFGFNAGNQLQYRGRLDASTKKNNPPDMPRELFDAMALIAKTGAGPEAQTPSMGCSIKWKEA